MGEAYRTKMTQELIIKIKKRPSPQIKFAEGHGTERELKNQPGLLWGGVQQRGRKARRVIKRMWQRKCIEAPMQRNRQRM